MEANVMMQNTGLAPADLSRVRQPAASPSPAAAPARTPSVQQSSAPATPAAMNIAPSAGILNAHSTVAPNMTEDLVAFSMPVGDDEISASSLNRVVNTINEALAPSFFRLDLSVHDDTNLVMVQVVDTETKEVLREFPPESRLDLMARIQEFAGLLFDSRS